jgi:diguanylate cyclase (GGDEF)-like protein
MHQESHTTGIAERAHAPEIGALLERYASFAVGGLGAPFAAFNIAALDQYRDNLMLLSPDGRGDYAYLHFGRDLIKAFGFDQTGRRVGDLPPEMAIFAIRNFDRARKLGCALYTVQRAAQSSRASIWESLILPVITEPGDSLLLVFTKPIEFREQLLSAVLDSSRDGVFAFAALREGDGRIEDAIITTVNRRAAEIIGRGVNDLVDRSALQTLPLLTASNLWERCVAVMDSGSMDRFEIDYTIQGREYWFQIALTALEDGLVMTLTDVTELKRANLALQSRAESLAIEIGRERASIRALSTEITARERRETELRRMAETDPLTLLLNRRTFETAVVHSIARSHATNVALSIIIVDLDHFKAVNDTYGHATGDTVLRAMAEKLASSVRRDSDHVGRLGGEEFAVCLPSAEAAHARRIAESLRGALAGTSIPTACGKIIRVTASFGVATLLPGEDFEQLFERADRALYAAKSGGRNCVRWDESDDAQLKLV